MSDPILLFLAFLVVALLGLAICVGVLPATVAGLLFMGASMLGLLLGLMAIVLSLPTAQLILPFGPPNLSLHFALDPLSLFFLVVILASATVVAGYGTQAERPAGHAGARRAAVCVAGLVLTLLAADAVTLAIGSAIACAAVWIDATRRGAPALVIPLLLLASISLLTPAGYAPRFDAIRAAPPGAVATSAAAVLTLGAVAGMIVLPSAERGPVRGALHAGLMMPASTYLLLRLVAELPATGAQPFWGTLLMLTGGLVAVRQGWQAAEHPYLDRIADSLARTQAALAISGTGLTVLSRLADLPAAAGDALAGTLLLSATGLANTVVALAAHALAAGAGTYRLSRLGGLIHSMRASSLALSAGLFSLAALPPSLGFACLWLLLRAVLAAPRQGGLPQQLSLALTAAAIVLAAVLTTTASLRLGGIAVLSRPRTARAAAAIEIKPPLRAMLLSLAAASMAFGLLPGSALALLATPVLRNLTGVAAVVRAGPFAAGPGYLALPTAALLGFAVGAVLLLRRWRPRDVRVASPWSDGQDASEHPPFGDPSAQSAGQGFLPRLPPRPRLQPRVPRKWPEWRLPAEQIGFWLLLAAAGAGLVVLALIGSVG